MITELKKRVILGIGTGRCGTHSLQTVLNEQKDTDYITHEFDKRATSWQLDETYIEYLFKAMLARRGKIVGDVGYQHLPNIETILNNKNNVKVIALKRDKDLVVQSYIKSTEFPGNDGFNHWTDRSSSHWYNGNYVEIIPRNDYRHGQHYERRFPKYDLPKKEALGAYHDDYYIEVQRLEKLFPNLIRTFDVPDVLNDEQTQIKMLSFAGFKPKDFVIRLNVKLNQSHK